MVEKGIMDIMGGGKHGKHVHYPSRLTKTLDNPFPTIVHYVQNICAVAWPMLGGWDGRQNGWASDPLTHIANALPMEGLGGV